VLLLRGCDACCAVGGGLQSGAALIGVRLEQTWTDVSKIRLVRGRAYLDDQCTRYYVELVRQGTDGEETVRIEHGFSLTVLPGYTPVQVFARRLREELHLRHAFVDGVEEYAV
jgi:hypothetical protein